MTGTTFLPPESALPTRGYNVVADRPAPPEPPRGPDGRTLTPQALETRLRFWAHVTT